MKTLRRLMTGLCLVLVMSGSASWAAAKAETGKDLLGFCGSRAVPSGPVYAANMTPTAAMAAGICYGYILGAVENSTELYCPSRAQRPISEQTIAVVVKYLIGHPELGERDAPELIVAAVQEAFPCPKDKGSVGRP